METGIFYAIVAGLFPGNESCAGQTGTGELRREFGDLAGHEKICHGSPMLGALTMHATGLLLLVTFGGLLKIELKWQRVPTASFLCFVCAGVLQAIGSVFTLNALLYAPASVVAPIWNTQPIISFFLACIVLKRIEVVTFRDGIAAALVVIGVLVMRWA